MFTEKEQAFVDELTELSRKHRIVIWGCGCCDSPCLMGMDEEGLNIDPSSKYGTSNQAQVVWLDK